MSSVPTDSGSTIPVIRTLPELREWRRRARDRRLDVGLVPTMGALHQGHLDLAKVSLRDNPLTVVSIFVNPMQFAPHEDLSTYPRGLLKDLGLLDTLLPASSPTQGFPSGTEPSANQFDKSKAVRGLGVSEYDSRPSSSGLSTRGSAAGAGSLQPGESPLLVFAPTDETMYPLRGELQDLSRHRGLNVVLRGYGDVMEGTSRPQFFTGVATVCTKLFNAVEPDHAYFGQKDIQQALLIRTLLKDMLCDHPSPERLHIVPTTRDTMTGLALSSRNVYLSPAEYAVAPIFAQSLRAAYDLYHDAVSPSASRPVLAEDLMELSIKVVMAEKQRLVDAGSDVTLKMDYVEVFDRDTFEPVRGPIEKGRKMVIAGAVWVGKTRILDNLLLGWDLESR